MKCVRCHVNIPDKALFCPWCGKQQDATSAPVHRKKRRRPKGSGSVYKLKGVRARPYVAVTGKRKCWAHTERREKPCRRLTHTTPRTPRQSA